MVNVKEVIFIDKSLIKNLKSQTLFRTILTQRLIIILSITLFSFLIFFNIAVNVSDNVMISSYKEILQSLINRFDIREFEDFMVHPKKTSESYDNIYNYLNSYAKNLKLDSIYISTIDLVSNQEIVLIDGIDDSIALEMPITSELGHKVFDKKEIMCKKVRQDGDIVYSFYAPILNNEGICKGLIAFNVIGNKILPLTFGNLFEQIFLIIILILAFLIIYIYLSTLEVWGILRPIYIIKHEVLTISNKIFSINTNISFSSYEFNIIQRLFVKSIALINNFIMSLIIYLEYIKFSISKVKLASIEITNKVKLMISYIVKTSKSTDLMNREVGKLKLDISKFSNEITDIKNDLRKVLDLNNSGVSICLNNNSYLNEFLIEIGMLIQKFKFEQSECMKLKVLSDKINDILENILTITNETKLLSLNASIVAISAGEHGKSFGVIAKEVGELSQNIIRSTGYIQQTLIKISETINHLNTKSIKIFNLFKSHLGNSEVFASKLTEIYNSMRNISNSIKDVSYSTEKISTKNSTILENINVLSISSSSNLNSIKQVENLIDQINDNAVSFRKNFDALNDNINQIKFDLSEFKL